MKQPFVAACALVVLLLSTDARAVERPINLSLFDPVQIVERRADIKGFRFNFAYGVNRRLKGFDVGLVNRLNGGLKGIQIGAVNWVEGRMVGIQGGWVSYLGSGFEGAQLSVGNYAIKGRGIQLGAVNYARTMSGLQIGFVNIAERLVDGLQIGLFNIAKNGFLPIFVFLNFQFDWSGRPRHRPLRTQ